jgi:aspartyl-tRNA(Asn)/glutamyl-tRNA(Gln) amidotransferase subunit C
MNEQILDSLAVTNKLRLSNEERQLIMEDFARFFEALVPLTTAELAQVEPLYQVVSQNNIMREDLAIKKISRDDLLANAPEQIQGCFAVPKVIDQCSVTPKTLLGCKYFGMKQGRSDAS